MLGVPEIQRNHSGGGAWGVTKGTENTDPAGGGWLGQNGEAGVF